MMARSVDIFQVLVHASCKQVIEPFIQFNIHRTLTHSFKEQGSNRIVHYSDYAAKCTFVLVFEIGIHGGKDGVEEVAHIVFFIKSEGHCGNNVGHIHPIWIQGPVTQEMDLWLPKSFYRKLHVFTHHGIQPHFGGAYPIQCDQIIATDYGFGVIWILIGKDAEGAVRTDMRVYETKMNREVL